MLTSDDEEEKEKERERELCSNEGFLFKEKRRIDGWCADPLIDDLCVLSIFCPFSPITQVCVIYTCASSSLFLFSLTVIVDRLMCVFIRSHD